MRFGKLLFNILLISQSKWHSILQKVLLRQFLVVALKSHLHSIKENLFVMRQRISSEQVEKQASSFEIPLFDCQA